MKFKTISTIVFCSFLSLSLFGQVKLGFKAGIHSYDLPSSEPNTGFIGIKAADYGFHAGVFTKIQLAGIYVEPSVIFNNIIAKYSVESPNDPSSDHFVNLDVPLMIGWKLLFLDLHAGPVAHIRLSDYGEIFNLPNDTVENAFWGLQFGTSIGLGQNWALEVRYEKNFDDGRISLDVGEYQLVDQNSRMMASMVYSF